MSNFSVIPLIIGQFVFFAGANRFLEKKMVQYGSGWQLP